MSTSTPRIAFAGGNRDISASSLRFLVEEGARPLALLLTDEDGPYTDEMLTLCKDLVPHAVVRGPQFKEAEGLQLLRDLELDYLVCVQFPYIVPKSVLDIPRIGVTNLHPALLPYNRGWHTPTWTILDETPYGATLHFMAESVDTGDVIHQKELPVAPDETADSLYQKVKALELEVFEEAWPLLASGSPPRVAQDDAIATSHKRRDLFTPGVQEIDLHTPVPPEDLIRRLRALTTNSIEEAAYMTVDGRRYRLRIAIQADD